MKCVQGLPNAMNNQSLVHNCHEKQIKLLILSDTVAKLPDVNTSYQPTPKAMKHA